jgi:5-methylcytosine-specific restriction endonuclease McrA
MKPAGIGALFENRAKSDFLRLTGSRYDAMKTRIERNKKQPPLPFTKDEFRAHVLNAMNGNQDGAVVCRYCNQVTTLAEMAVDHAYPLSRGGSAGLDNLEYPCKHCNDRKGSLSPDEYLALLAFLETKIPLGRIDVLKRLEQSIKLAAGARRAMMLVKGSKAPKKDQLADDGMPDF